MAISERFLIRPGSAVRLSAIDADAPAHVTREWARRKVRKATERLADLQYLLFANAGPSVLIVIQGPDAAGKDGLIKHLFEGLNPHGVTVTAFEKPTPVEADHDFLWRVHRHAPAKGKIAVFNRSHYEAVLVERVRKLAPKRVWQSRYAMINAFEELLAQNGTRVVKFFLHIDADEQLERFRRRLDDRRRQWKISEDDYTDRALWPQFVEANEAMLERTSTPAAPWYVIPANQKWFRDFAVSKILVGAMKELGLTIPPPSVEIAKIRRKYHEAKRGDR